MERELAAAMLVRYRSSASVVLVASVLLNLIVFAGSIYMILVYDSVLPSRSLPTLAGLFGILVVMYVCQGTLDIVRSEAQLQIANGVHDEMFERVNHASVNRALTGRASGDGMQLIRDLDQVHAYVASPGPAAFIDLPWVLVFLIVLSALHWSLGLAALLGVLVMTAIALWTNRRTAAGTQQLLTISDKLSAAALAEHRLVESSVALGMRRRLMSRSSGLRSEFLDAQSFLSRTIARLGGAGRVFRIFLQSLILTVGALLVIDEQATGGIILASSVLAGRALAPVDQAIGNWRGFASAKAGWSRIAEALRSDPLAPAREVKLPPPRRGIQLRDVWVAPPASERFVVTGVGLALEAGQALAIVGPSAAGKTSLLKAMAGIWPAKRGEIRLDGADFAQWDEEFIGACVGYLPQATELVHGTIGQNIARFDPAASSDAVVSAARQADIHEMILALPNGYDTVVSGGGAELSAGQRQRVGLARALYGEPFLVLLDEPNSNLDAAGDAALASAIEGVRKRGGIVVMVTHRPATLGPVSHIAVLAAGRLSEFGERDAVLKKVGGASSSAPQRETATS